MIEALGAVALILLVVGGALLHLRRVTHKGTAVTSSAISRARRDVERAAPTRGWTVQSGPQLARSFPDDLAMKFAPAEDCEFAVESRGEAPFAASTWLIKVRMAGSPVAQAVRQHYVAVPLASPTGTTPRFALGKPYDLKATTRNLPDDLVPQDRYKVGGCWVHGEDDGWAQALAPIASELADQHVWLIVTGDRVVLTRQGELDAEALDRRVDLATRAAALLERGCSAR